VLESHCHTRLSPRWDPPVLGVIFPAAVSAPWPNGEVVVDKFKVNDLVELLASMEDTVGRVTGVREGGTRIRVVWERRRGYEGYTTIHHSSALRKIPVAK